jgi:hypothetical protein
MWGRAGVGVVALVLVAGTAGASDWQTVAEKPVVIRVRERTDMPGVREVWAEGELAANAWAVQAALTDHESFHTWMPYVKESRLVSSSTPGERVTYTRVEPPVVSSRDFVLYVHDERTLDEGGGGEFIQSWRADAGLLPKRHGVVRLKHNEGRWRVTPQGEGRARFVYRFTVEPGGSIPGFLASLGQKEAVQGTVKALERRAQQLAEQRRQQGQ